MSKCPVCGQQAYVGFSKVECSNADCRHHDAGVAKEEGIPEWVKMYSSMKVDMRVVRPSGAPLVLNRDSVPVVLAGDYAMPKVALRKYQIDALNMMNDDQRRRDEAIREVCKTREGAAALVKAMISPKRTTLKYCDVCGGDKSKCRVVFGRHVRLDGGH